MRVPTITDPRGTDFAAADRLRQQPWMVELERRAVAAFESFGILMTDTCINYQTIMPPVRGEHVAFGDTGVVIYSNSVLGARSNFEGGPSALSAGLTGRTPRYGYHDDERRQATLSVRVTWTPRELDEWGALGGIVGRLAGDYWQVPVLTGIDRVPNSDEMKHFGAALASYGSVALFHMAEITPEAQRVDDVLGPDCRPAGEIGLDAIRDFAGSYAAWPRRDRPRRILRTPAQPDRDAAGCRPARRAASDDPAFGGDQPTSEARRRSHGYHPAHRGGRRHRPVRHVLLPELCPRDGRSQWLEEAGHQFRQAHQHHRRLRLPARTALHGDLHRRGLHRETPAVSEHILHAKSGTGRTVRGVALVASDGFSARYDLDRVRGVFSRPEHKAAPLAS